MIIINLYEHAYVFETCLDKWREECVNEILNQKIIFCYIVYVAFQEHAEGLNDKISPQEVY